MDAKLTYEEIIADMKNPSMLTPRKVFEYTSFLAALYAERHVSATEYQVTRARFESEMVEKGMTSSSARSLAQATDSGIMEMKARSALKSLEELIRALKRMAAYLSEESRNQY